MYLHEENHIILMLSSYRGCEGEKTGMRERAMFAGSGLKFQLLRGGWAGVFQIWELHELNSEQEQLGKSCGTRFQNKNPNNIPGIEPSGRELGPAYEQTSDLIQWTSTFPLASFKWTEHAWTKQKL